EVRVVDAPDECHHGQPLLTLPAVDAEATEAYLATARSGARPLPREAVILPFRQVWSSGALPPGWHVTQGAFTHGDGALEASSGEEVSVTVLHGVEGADVRVSAQVEVTGEGEGDRQAGLVVRHSGPGEANSYLGTLISQEGRLSVDLWRHGGRCWEL